MEAAVPTAGAPAPAVRPAPVPAGPDYWARLPASLLGYAHVLGEVAVPLAPKLLSPLSVVTMGYIAMSSIDRGNMRSKLEPHPELRRYNGYAAGFEAALGGWVSLITLPSLALGFVVGPATSLFQANAGRLPAAAVRAGPTAVAAALLPLLMPACAAGSEAVLEWAVRPLIDSYRPPLSMGGPRPDYEAPSPEEVLGIAGILPATLDPADRARLAWAMDGDASSPYPDEEGSGGGKAPQPSSSAVAAEDAAFLASLAEYASRVQAARTSGAAAAAAAASDVVTDYDRMVAAAVDDASGGRLSRARAVAAEATRGAAAPPAGAGTPLR